MTQDLKATRRDIDTLDEEILDRICRRAALALETAQAKKTSGSCYDPAREAQVLRRVREANPGPLSDDSIARLFRQIMSACLALEHPTRVAYLGPEGTFTQQAAQRHFGDFADTIAFDDIESIFREVESSQADFGVVPAENSSDGVVANTLDMFASSPLKIAGELDLPIHHHLLAGAADFSGVRQVLAHLQALAQCRHWLDRNLPHAERIPVSSNAAAALRAAEQEGAAAIAPRSAAEHYGLPVLASNIENHPNNRTRFLVLGRHDQKPSGDDKTSLLVAAHNRPGSLLRLLQPLANAGIDMTRIESRPQQDGSAWEYLFFLDLRGHATEQPLAEALVALKEVSALCKVLGSYPRATG